MTKLWSGHLEEAQPHAGHNQHDLDQGQVGGEVGGHGGQARRLQNQAGRRRTDHQGQAGRSGRRRAASRAQQGGGQHQSAGHRPEPRTSTR